MAGKLSKSLLPLISLLMVLCYESATIAQDKGQLPIRVNADGGACELNSSFLSVLLVEAKRKRGQIIIVSRLAERERLILNRIRLTNARSLILIKKLVPSRRVITRTGKRNGPSQRGTVEFYLDGKLFLVSEAPFNESPCLDCCDSP